MPTAFVKVLKRQPYNGDVIEAALRRMGFDILSAPSRAPQAGDVLVQWNRYARDEADASRYEKAGATVLIVENGYFGRNFLGNQWYAIAKSQHNGAGVWPKGDINRWQSFGIELKPWRADGEEVVILAQRGMGSNLCREPADWPARAHNALTGLTRRPVRIRQHPGPQGAVPAVSLEDDLSNAWAAVTWGSSAGLKALAMGIPVFHGFSQWIGKGAAKPFGSEIEAPLLGVREGVFARVATAMWSLEEIREGKPFRCLLG